MSRRKESFNGAALASGDVRVVGGEGRGSGSGKQAPILFSKEPLLSISMNYPCPRPRTHSSDPSAQGLPLGPASPAIGWQLVGGGGVGRERGGCPRANL